MQNAYSRYTDISGTLCVRLHNDVKVEPLMQIPGISESHRDDIIIDDCDFCARLQSADSDSIFLEGNTLYGGYIRSQWGHFLLNTLARLWYLKSDISPGFDHILFFADKNVKLPLKGNYKEVFELLGISDKVIIADAPVSVHRLIVPDIALEHPVKYSTEFLSPFLTIKERINRTKPRSYSTKVFLTRSRLPKASRNEINIEYLDRFFADNGYEIVAPEQLSVSELTHKLHSASVIASVSGSTAHNFLFAPNDARFIVIERSAACNPFQIPIDMLTGNNHTYIDSFVLPRIAPATGSLFLYSATAQLQQFISDNSMLPHRFPQSESARRNELRRFLWRYRRLYRHTIGLSLWDIDNAPAVAEAYICSEPLYIKWLSSPVFF